MECAEVYERYPQASDDTNFSNLSSIKSFNFPLCNVWYFMTGLLLVNLFGFSDVSDHNMARQRRHGVRVVIYPRET